ncbi:WD domain G-beta repeat [Carpediemonas membranifera]|uniref:WD domain G-beta repeat n=1 Tax=Carpediemonas membranifera TaxID=201153 RepID=A0A8J6E304_9EUKA|nr:WD domain G-beta repeat [Carpediemonas membranifera]|eukprot:KAG9394976.1 WD domain G-beta repeat [Carpediemonas membranifera]
MISSRRNTAVRGRTPTKASMDISIPELELESEKLNPLSVETEEQLLRLRFDFAARLDEQNKEAPIASIETKFVGAGNRRKKKLPGLTRDNFVECLSQNLGVASHAADVIFDVLKKKSDPMDTSDGTVTFLALMTAITTQTRVCVDRVLEKANPADTGVVKQAYPQTPAVIERFGHRKNIEVLAVTGSEWVSVGHDGVAHLWHRVPVTGVTGLDSKPPRAFRSVLDPHADVGAPAMGTSTLPAVIADTGLPDDKELDPTESRRRRTDYVGYSRRAEDPLPSQRPPAPVLPTGMTLPPKTVERPGRFMGGTPSATENYMTSRNIRPSTPQRPMTPRSPAPARPSTSHGLHRPTLLTDTLARTMTPPAPPRTPGPAATFRPRSSQYKRRHKAAKKVTRDDILHPGDPGRPTITSAVQKSLQTWCTSVCRITVKRVQYLLVGTLRGEALLLDDAYVPVFRADVGAPVTGVAWFARPAGPLVSDASEGTARKKVPTRKKRTRRRPAKVRVGKWRPPERPTGEVQTVIMVGTVGGAVMFFDAETMKLVKTTKEHGAAWVNCIQTFEDVEDRPLIVSAGGDGRMALWSAKTLAPTRRLGRHAGGIICIDYDAATKMLVSVGTDHTLKLWSPFVNDPTATVNLDKGSPIAVVLLESLNCAIVVFAEKLIVTYSLSSLQPIQTVHDPTTHTPIDRFTAAVFDRKAGILLTAGSFIRLWPLASVFNTALSQPAGRLSPAPSWTPRPESGPCVTATIGPLPARPHERKVVACVALNTALELAVADAVFASVDQGGVGHVWAYSASSTALQQVRSLALALGADITAAAIDRTGKRLLVGTVAGTFARFEPYTGTRVAAAVSGAAGSGEVVSMFVDSDPTDFPYTVGFGQGRCYQYDDKIDTVFTVGVRDLSGHTGDIVAVDKLVSPGDIPHSPVRDEPTNPYEQRNATNTRQPFLVTASTDGVVATWDPFRGNRQQVHQLDTDIGGIVDMAVISSDRIAVLTQSGKVHLVAPLSASPMIQADCLEVSPARIAALSSPPTLAAVEGSRVFLYSLVDGGHEKLRPCAEFTITSNATVSAVIPLSVASAFAVGLDSGHVAVIATSGQVLLSESTGDDVLSRLNTARPPATPQPPSSPASVRSPRPRPAGLYEYEGGRVVRTPLGDRKLRLDKEESAESTPDDTDSERGSDASAVRVRRPPSSLRDMWGGSRPQVMRFVKPPEKFQPLLF